MLTHDDACLGDVCALATHDCNLGYYLPVGRQPTLCFVLPTSFLQQFWLGNEAYPTFVKTTFYD